MNRINGLAILEVNDTGIPGDALFTDAKCFQVKWKEQHPAVKIFLERVSKQSRILRMIGERAGAPTTKR
jgi:hypothetical protein